MGAPLPDEPCIDLPARPPIPGGRPLRVVEVLATGTNGGAQEHVYSLLSRLDRTRYEASVVSLSPGSAVRAIQRLGIPVIVFDEPDDAIAVGALAAHLSDVGAEVVHNHMYRAELVGTRAAIALGEAGHRRPWVIGTVHSSRIRAADDREVLRHLTPRMDHLVAVSRAIVRKIADERPSAGARLPGPQRRGPDPLRPDRGLLHAPRRVRDGARRADRRASSAGWSPRRATPP